jgi:hypothetical protein
MCSETAKEGTITLNRGEAKAGVGGTQQGTETCRAHCMSPAGFLGEKREKMKGMKRPADRVGNRPKCGRSAWGSDEDKGNKKMVMTVKCGKGAGGMNAHI